MIAFRSRTLAVLAVAALLAACSSGSSSRLGRMYSSLQSEVAEREPGALSDAAIERHHAERASEVRELVSEGKVKTARDHLQAAVLLVETDDPADLVLAESLGLRAAELGEARGKRVAAEAVDKQLVRRRMAQRYGTQYEWVPVLRAWRLYPVDPRTTDEERRAMGVPPLAEIHEGENRLNEALRAR